MSSQEQLYLNKLIELYFHQPSILYDHLFGSFHQLVEEIIPYSLQKYNNYFYESVEDHMVYLHGFECTNVRIRPPVFENNNEILFPREARKNHLNYFGTVLADVRQFVEKEDTLTNEKTTIQVGEMEERIAIGNLPIMIKSKYCSTRIKKDLHGECKYDPGGYFIVNGQEKVVMSIEKMVDNKILVFTKKDTSYKDGFVYTAQINSRKDDWSDNLQIFTLRNKKSGVYNITCSQLSDIPVFILFRAMGIESDHDIIANIIYNMNDTKMLNLLRPSVALSTDEEGVPIRTREEAFEYLITKLRRNRRISLIDEDLAKIQKKMFLNKIIRRDIFPHLGDDIPKKIRFLGLMMNRLLNVMLGRIKPDDRDSLQNKRVESAGILISQLWRQNWRKMLNEIGKNFKKKNQQNEKPINIINQIKPTTIEQGIKTALATGIWGMNRTKKGVAQSLQRLSWIQSISYLRRVMAPSLDAATSGVVSIRHVNNISINFLCPVETPEGAKIGIVKSLAMTSTLSLQNSSQKIIIDSILKEFKNFKHPYDIDPLTMNDWGKIFFNGNWVGVTKKIMELYKLFKEKRDIGVIDKFTSIYLDFQNAEIRIYYDGGRLIRPIMRVNNNELGLTKSVNLDIDKILKGDNVKKGWKELLTKYPYLIEYEDIESSRFLMIAETPKYLEESRNAFNKKIDEKNRSEINRYGEYRYIKYTHCDFHPWLMLGTISCGIPFSNHNYGVKNIINFSQAKQAIGTYLTSYKDRMDISQILYHPQIPLVTTEGMKYNRMLDLPAGENAIVAIMSYGGFNQEDSLIFNQSAIDRGIFRADTLKKYHSVIEKNPSTSQDDIFVRPDRNKVTGMKQGNYDKLNEKGYVPEETEVDNEDIIIGKVSPIQPTGNNNKVYKDNSEIFKSNVKGVIDRVHTGIYNKDGYEMYNVRVRMERIPIIGDKFTNKHGQKGTIGIAFPQKDMPFTEEGMVPDLMMNPHAIPSRMTVAQLVECLSSKIGAIEGKFIDGTPFNNYDVRQLPKILKKLGYSATGTETMYCGITGKKIKAQIFIGPTYYMRLKHMVLDKVHSRSRGPRQALTRQPLEGRSRDGGLKIGEMEKDAMVAHGIGQFLKERMMETSDITKVYVCDECGLFASRVMDRDYHICPSCLNSHISAINMPHACKLLFQELMSINIVPRIKTAKTIYDHNV